MQKKDIVWFDEVGKEDVGLVGGKGANLGEMTKAGFPIPFGFIITSKAYFEFVERAKIKDKIAQFLKNLDPENPHELSQASKNVKRLILNAPFPMGLALKIIDHYNELHLKEETFLNKKLGAHKRILHRVRSIYKNPLVAVRSSATAEDLPNASFAGQQETFLNVKGEHNLIQKVKECFASLFTERAIYYRHNQGFNDLKIGLACVVQRMVQSEKSGVAFSTDPVTNNKNKIVIEAVYGLGEYIVQGKVTPDHYEVDKRSFIILERLPAVQKIKLVRSGVVNRELKISRREGSKQKLKDRDILRLALLVAEIEKHYYFPQDIEWALEKGRVYIVQSRPITTIKPDQKGERKDEIKIEVREKPFVIGSPASPGIGIGPVCILRSPKEISKLKTGDILVAEQTNPDYVPAMKKAAAIVTEKGGRTSHAAIVSRELGIPAVVGAENALKTLRDNIVISVNGETGEIFKGSVLKSVKASGEAIKKERHAPLKTLTKVYVNLAEPDEAIAISERDVDGVGLLRAEFMIADIGTHPREFIKRKQEGHFTGLLAKELLRFAKAFEPRPVIYRATDFKTNEYRHLRGGEKYEKHEENPMLGFRGAARYITNPEVFNLELEALKRVWGEGYSNMHLMIPFVRAPWELIKVKELISKSGFSNFPKFKLFIMVEVPSAAIVLEELLKIGVDGVSIGSNDLTMMILGVDRDNEEIAHIYDERSPAVVTTLENIVKTCSKYGVSCSICGQAASDYPELVEKLINLGIDSVSVNPDAIERTRKLIYDIEKNKHQKTIRRNAKLNSVKQKLLEISS